MIKRVINRLPLLKFTKTSQRQGSFSLKYFLPFQCFTHSSLVLFFSYHPFSFVNSPNVCFIFLSPTCFLVCFFSVVFSNTFEYISLSYV